MSSRYIFIGNDDKLNKCIR